MGIFRVTLTIRHPETPYPTKTTVVLREFPGTDIDAVWHKLELKSKEKWGRELKGFDCVMISKRSAEYKAFLATEEKKRTKPEFKVVPGHPRGSGHVHPFAQQEMKKQRH